MLFSSLVFLFYFLPFVMGVYYLILRKKRKLQNIFLLCVSLIFYAWGEPSFVLIMLLSIISNWFFALKIDKNRANQNKTQLILILMLTFNLVILFIFKYLNFVISNINIAFGNLIINPKISLPIGISFFTFQAISYVIDVYRNQGRVQRNPLNVGLYISFFPQLIAGPIVRYQTIVDQIIDRIESFDDFFWGVKRFIIGLAKKILIANNMAIIATESFKQGTDLSVSMAWLGIVAYSFQIYFDFSGYSDMAIGLGRMFGFHFLENFNYPYISKSITEFWRRWHISLSSWFRDYVYFPMGGSRVNSIHRLIFNLFIVWLLTGFWHGANWTFIVWGLLFFCLLVIEKTTPILKVIGKFGHVYTLFFVIISWVLFKSDSLSHASFYLKTMFGNSSLIDNKAIMYFSEFKYFYIIAVIASTPIFPMLKKLNFLHKTTFKLIYSFFLIFIFILSISYIVKGSYNPFIYFNF